MLCKKCGKNPCYERNGRVFALCSVCSWDNLMELLDLPDSQRSPTLRAPDQTEQSGFDTEPKCMCPADGIWPGCPIHGRRRSNRSVGG